MKRRILHVYRSWFPDTQGGIEEFIRTLAVGMPRSRYDVTVLFPSKHVRRSEEIDFDGVRVCRVPELFEIASCNVFLRGLADYRRWAMWADAVHYHFPWPFADLLHLLQSPSPRKPAILTYHSDIVRQRTLGYLYAPLMRRFLGSCDRIVATSPDYVATSPVLAMLGKAVEVIPIGIDPERLPEVDQALRAHWQSRVGSGFFFFVGVLRYYKGLDVLLRAVAGTGLRVVVSGEGPEGARLRQLALELGADNVVFTGRISDSDKRVLMDLSRAFVFPSNRRAEAYGVALLEAMACGKALITVDVGSGMNFVNPDGQTGVWVQPDDPGALRAAMQRLAQDESLCARMGAAGRERVSAALSASGMISAYDAIYTEVCGETT